MAFVDYWQCQATAALQLHSCCTSTSALSRCKPEMLPCPAQMFLQLHIELIGELIWAKTSPAKEPKPSNLNSFLNSPPPQLLQYFCCLEGLHLPRAETTTSLWGKPGAGFFFCCCKGWFLQGLRNCSFISVSLLNSQIFYKRINGHIFLPWLPRHTLERTQGVTLDSFCLHHLPAFNQFSLKNSKLYLLWAKLSLSKTRSHTLWNIFLSSHSRYFLC